MQLITKKDRIVFLMSFIGSLQDRNKVLHLNPRHFEFLLLLYLIPKQKPLLPAHLSTLSTYCLPSTLLNLKKLVSTKLVTEFKGVGRSAYSISKAGIYYIEAADMEGLEAFNTNRKLNL